MATYHRLHSATQEIDVAVRQLNTSELRGTAPYGSTNAPSAKAFFGTLPVGRSGIEFTTLCPPSSSVGRQGGQVFWHSQSGHAQLIPLNPAFCSIPITITLLRYSLAAMPVGIDVTLP